jgi:hypothetical protein
LVTGFFSSAARYGCQILTQADDLLAADDMTGLSRTTGMRQGFNGFRAGQRNHHARRQAVEEIALDIDYEGNDRRSLAVGLA